MEQQSAFSFAGQATYEAWKYLPVTYLHCEGDSVFPYEFQKTLVEKIRKSGRDVDVINCRSGHCPNVSNVESVVHAIRRGSGVLEDDLARFQCGDAVVRVSEIIA